MKYIYLVRHGKPSIPLAACLCIGGKSDPPLFQQEQTNLLPLSHCFSHLSAIYCSKMLRSVETAKIISQNNQAIKILENAQEIDVGLWEGLPFEQIAQNFPETYSQRGNDWSIPPNGGETLEHAANRIEAVIKNLVNKTAEREIAIVCHDGLIRALIWRILKLNPKADKMPKQPYGSITVIKLKDEAMSITAIGKACDATPDENGILKIWAQCNISSQIKSHSIAVCQKAMELGEIQKRKGASFSEQAVYCSALLHDICRANGKNHDQLAASLLRERGYLNIADIVSKHHNGNCIRLEDKLLFLADKLVYENTPVTLEQRFAISGKKCTTPQAKEMHRLRYDKAKAIEQQLT